MATPLSVLVSDSRIALGVLSVFIGTVAYVIYVQQTLRKKHVQPHPLSWFVFAFITGVATVIQWKKGAGPGAWVTAATAVSCIAIWLVALFKQRRQRTAPDLKDSSSAREWFCFALGLLAALFFGVAKDATLAAILATIADLFGFQPTVAKGWALPNSDSATAFILNGVKFIPAYFALSSVSIATALFPVSLIFMNLAFALMLLGRRAFLSGERP